MIIKIFILKNKIYKYKRIIISFFIIIILFEYNKIHNNGNIWKYFTKTYYERFLKKTKRKERKSVSCWFFKYMKKLI